MDEQDGLSEECGHHCGVITNGKNKHTGHCSCDECHGGVYET